MIYVPATWTTTWTKGTYFPISGLPAGPTLLTDQLEPKPVAVV